jgi:hypothetical protein
MTQKGKKFMNTFLDTPLVDQPIWPGFVKDVKKIHMDSIFDIPTPKGKKK